MHTLNRKLAALAAAALLGLAGCASTPGGNNFFDDAMVTARVKTAIYNEPSLKVAQINVETFKGVVQLSGFVSSPAAVNTAATVARNVAGVKSVKNDMRLK